MNRPLFTTTLFVFGAVAASGQTLRFKDGRTAELSAARVINDQLRLPVDPDHPDIGEILLPIASLERIDWPEPAEFTQSFAALKSGELENALTQNDALLANQEPFRDIPGSWWPQTMLLRTAILAHLGRDSEAEAACERLRLSSLGAPLVDHARLALIDAMVSSGKREQARERLEALAESARSDKAIAAHADLARARILQAEGKIDDALLTYLRIPVLYSAQTAPAPGALLGAASCFRALDEKARAESTLLKLIERFPDSPEAAQARTFLPTP